jgi:hypothetical protein
MSEKQQQIYYMLAYDVNAGKWMNADHIFGVFTDGKTVYEADDPGAEGKWIPLDAHVPELLDQDSDNIAVLSAFLRQANTED